MTPESMPQELLPKEVFMDALDKELSTLVQSGRITEDRAEEKRSAGMLIEESFSDDPKHDALVFALAGNTSESEMVEVFNRKKNNAEEEDGFADEESLAKDVFFHTVRDKVGSLCDKGELSGEYVQNLLDRAVLIEGPFDDADDAKEKAFGFLKTIEPVVELMRILNNTEMQLLSAAGDISISMEEVRSNANIDEEKKVGILNKLSGVLEGINGYSETIKAVRNNIF